MAEEEIPNHTARFPVEIGFHFNDFASLRAAKKPHTITLKDEAATMYSAWLDGEQYDPLGNHETRFTVLILLLPLVVTLIPLVMWWWNISYYRKLWKKYGVTAALDRQFREVKEHYTWILVGSKFILATDTDWVKAAARKAVLANESEGAASRQRIKRRELFLDALTYSEIKGVASLPVSRAGSFDDMDGDHGMD